MLRGEVGAASPSSTGVENIVSELLFEASVKNQRYVEKRALLNNSSALS